MAISADQCIGQRNDLAIELTGGNHGRDVLKIDLMDNTGGWWHDREVRKSLLAPAQKLVALLIALKLILSVELQRSVGAKHVHLQRVVDHQIHG